MVYGSPRFRGGWPLLPAPLLASLSRWSPGLPPRYLPSRAARASEELGAPHERDGGGTGSAGSAREGGVTEPTLSSDSGRRRRRSNAGPLCSRRRRRRRHCSPGGPCRCSTRPRPRPRLRLRLRLGRRCCCSTRPRGCHQPWSCAGGEGGGKRGEDDTLSTRARSREGVRKNERGSGCALLLLLLFVSASSLVAACAFDSTPSSVLRAAHSRPVRRGAGAAARARERGRASGACDSLPLDGQLGRRAARGADHAPGDLLRGLRASGVGEGGGALHLGPDRDRGDVVPRLQSRLRSGERGGRVRGLGGDGVRGGLKDRVEGRGAPVQVRPPVFAVLPNAADVAARMR